jgi:hypothetical protein
MSGSRPRRGSGEGSVYLRSDGRWTASVEVDKRGGKRRRKVLYAPTKAELLRKLRAAQDRRHQGRPILDGRRTAGDFLAYWVDEILPGTITDNTLQGYRAVVRRDIRPYVEHTGQAVPLACGQAELLGAMTRRAQNLRPEPQASAARHRPSLGDGWNSPSSSAG